MHISYHSATPCCSSLSAFRMFTLVGRLVQSYAQICRNAPPLLPHLSARRLLLLRLSLLLLIVLLFPPAPFIPRTFIAARNIHHHRCCTAPNALDLRLQHVQHSSFPSLPRTYQRGALIRSPAAVRTPKERPPPASWSACSCPGCRPCSRRCSHSCSRSSFPCSL